MTRSRSRASSRRKSQSGSGRIYVRSCPDDWRDRARGRRRRRDAGADPREGRIAYRGRGRVAPRAAAGGTPDRSGSQRYLRSDLESQLLKHISRSSGTKVGSPRRGRPRPNRLLLLCPIFVRRVVMFTELTLRLGLVGSAITWSRFTRCPAFGMATGPHV